MPAWLPAAALVAALAAAFHADTALPPALGPDAPAAAFSEARALLLVDELCARGPRPAGSAAEAAALDSAAGFLRALAPAAARTGLRLEVDDRVVASGAVAYGVPGWSDASYSRLRLVTILLAPASFSPGNASAGRSALLVNAHADTVWVAAGSSDNTVAVATVLELARALVHSAPSPAPAAPLLFLLQSGEEEGMLGAAAFVARHPWARLVGGVVNLESMGSGGRALLFQATPGSAFLLEALAAQRAPLAASSVAADVFGSGLVRSDTDGASIGVERTAAEDG